MKHLKLLILIAWLSVVHTTEAQIVVEAGNAESLLNAIERANLQNADTLSERLFILIPDGVYDLGERVLTSISGHNIALVGQSMEGTIIVNAPKVENEGISTTATLLNRGHHTYVQDLTLKNALDYYHSGAAGRAVCWQDKGDGTIFKHVRMLSYQDTYYSDNEKCQNYMQDTEIHGTIDFICGAGDVWFEGCKIVTEKRTPDGSGINIITATRTSETPWGYIFNRCTIENDMSMFNYGRPWHTNPRCVWLRTTLITPEKLEATRFDDEGMKTSGNYFKEYHTMNAQGKDITPKTNVVTFTLRDHTQPFTAETIMTKEEYKQYTLKHIFGDWEPDKILKELDKQSQRVKKKHKFR